jgi:hypothetical protein
VPVVFTDLGGERRHAPVRRVDGHDVEVGVHEQRARRPVAARDPHDEAAAPRRRQHELAGDADLGEPIPDVAGGALLAVADRRRVARVHALDADQIARDLDRLLLQRGIHGLGLPRLGRRRIAGQLLGEGVDADLLRGQ